MNIFCTIFLTVISGVLVFIISQIIMEFIIKPKNKYKEIKSKILSCKKMFDVLKGKLNSYNMEKQTKTIKNLLNSVAILEYYNKQEDKRSELNENFREGLNQIRDIAFELAGFYEVYPKTSEINKEERDKIINTLFNCDNKIYNFKELDIRCDEIIKVLNDTIDKIKI